VKKYWLVLVVVLALVLALTNAAVFAYYPITVSATGVKPVYFDLGSNAGQADLGDNNNIAVTLGASGCSLDISVHPTYQETYYKNVSVIINTDTVKAYYIAFRVETPFSFPAGSQAKMRIFDEGNNLVGEVDLLTSGDTGWFSTPLSADSKFRIDLYFYYPEGEPLPSGATATVKLIYSPQNVETAP